MTVSFAIMAHPSRLAHVDVMLSRLAEQGAPHVPVFVGHPTAGAWAAAKPAWASAPTEPTHHVVLQDDISFCENFVRAVRSLAEQHPHNAVSFFAFRRTGLCRGAQAIMLPSDLARDFASWEPADAWVRFGRLDCPRLDGFLRARGVPLVITDPTLVEHVGSERSLIWRGSLGRSVDYVGDATVVSLPPSCETVQP